MEGGQDQLVSGPDKDFVLALLLGSAGEWVLWGGDDGGGKEVLSSGTTSQA